MSLFPLSIITPLGKIFDEKILSLKAPGVEGSFGVLNNHAPMIAALKEGVLSVTFEEGEPKFFLISSGVLEVSQNTDVLVLSDTATLMNNLQEAEDEMKKIKIT